MYDAAYDSLEKMFTIPPPIVQPIITTAHTQQELLESMDLAQYAVKGSEADWEAATKGISDKVGSVSIKSKVCPKALNNQSLREEGRGLRCVYLYTLLFYIIKTLFSMIFRRLS